MMEFTDLANLGSHWYDKLWEHMERVAEDGDEKKFNELMAIRKRFGKAEDDEDMALARIDFEKWEMANA